MKIVIKTNDRRQTESKRSKCEREAGQFCYMYPEKDPPPAGKTKIEPVRLKKEDKMIKKISPEDELRMNEKEIESVLHSDETLSGLRAEITERLMEMESDPAHYRAFFSQPGAARRFIRDCIDALE